MWNTLNSILYFGAGVAALFYAIDLAIERKRATFMVTLLLGLIAWQDAYSWSERFSIPVSTSVPLRGLELIGVFAICIAIGLAYRQCLRRAIVACLLYVMTCLVYWIALPHFDPTLFAAIQSAWKMELGKEKAFVIGFTVASAVLGVLLWLICSKRINGSTERSRWVFAAALGVYFFAYCLLR